MALAYGVAVFSDVDTASFTWVGITGPLTANPPITLSMAIMPTDGSLIEANLLGQPTNVGGTVKASASFTGLVIFLGMDPL